MSCLELLVNRFLHYGKFQMVDDVRRIAFTVPIVEFIGRVLQMERAPQMLAKPIPVV
jgi:hypothetical protein